MEHAPTQPDERLGQIRQGDRQVLAGVFDEHRDRLRRILAFRMDPRLAGRLDEEDVLQEAYMAAAQRCEHLQGDTSQSLFIWIRLIVLQTLADACRRHLGASKRDAGREVALRSPGGSTSTSMSLAANLLGRFTSPTLAARRTELSERLRATLESMDEIDREVLALRHFEEMTNGEVAEHLDIQPKAASIRYVRALRRLKDILVEMPEFMEIFDPRP